VKLKPTKPQRKIIEEWMNTSRYVYNKTVQCVRSGDTVNFYNLRDKLVTADTKKYNKEYIEIETLNESKKNLQKQWKNINNSKEITKEIKETEMEKYQENINNINTRMKECKKQLISVKKTLKSEKNKSVQEWELKTPKDIRAGAVNDVCKAHKTALANLKAGNIKFFHLDFRRKTNPKQCILIPKNAIKNKEGELTLFKQFLNENCKFMMGKRTKKKYKDFVINHDCRLVKEKNVYLLFIPVPMDMKPVCIPTESNIRYCGVDPGVRTLFTTFEKDGSTEYNYREELITKLDKKISRMKLNTLGKKRVLKRNINRIEKRKLNLINELHWKTINHLLENNDIIFFGNIKSHGIVKGGKNRTLNRNINNLKFYLLKERLKHKATEKRKVVYLINEEYTTKTCSCCGRLNNPGMSKEYSCLTCKTVVGRDVNAAKNILMKGIMSLT
jgi:IS605 OrfB family transposase